MPFTNYAELSAAVSGWLHRKDLTARIPDFIALAEVGFDRIAQVRLMENEVPLTLAAGERSVTLPAGFSTPLAVWLSDVQPREELAAMVPELLPVTTDPGRPLYWAIDGGSLAFERPSDVPRTVTLRYRGGFRLSDDAPTNALLAKYPDLYLYGTLLQAQPFLKNMEMLALWQSMYARTVSEINKTESRSRAVAPLRTELAGLLGRGCGDFYRGS